MCDRGILSKSSFVDARVLAQAPNDAPRELPEGFQPGPRDVICSRGADCFNNPGNKFFRSKLAEHLEEYSQAPNKMKKGIIVSTIIDEIREAGGAFVRQESTAGGQRFIQVPDRLAREKTGQALRSALRKSSPTALPASKSAMRKCDSPMSSKSSGSVGSRRDAVGAARSMFGEELGSSDRSLRTASSVGSAQIPTTLSALSPWGTRHRGDGLAKSNSARTWSVGDALPRESRTTMASATVPPPALRRSLTDPSQLDADDVSFVLPPTFMEERESSVFGLPLPSFPPPDTTELQRQVSTWSSVIARLPGLLDYDPYPSSSGTAAAAAFAAPEPVALRQDSFGAPTPTLGAHGYLAARRRRSAVPLEIRLDPTATTPQGTGRPTSTGGNDDDDIDLGEWDS